MPALGSLQRVVKPTTRKGKKVILAREPKVFENVKKALFMHGRKVNDPLRACVKDLFKLKKPNAELMSRKNDILPFEDISPIETQCRRHDSSIFFFASHNKKRPSNLVIGRLFDGNLLDMAELGLAKFKSMSEFPSDSTIPLGTKPCLLFTGELWENPELVRVKNLLIDVFRGEVIDAVRLQGLEHVIMFTATKENILVRSYRVHLKKSGTKLPRIELSEMGPSMDLVLRRTRLATEDLMRLACRTPQEAKSRPKKNITKDGLGTQHGRVHMGKQNVGTVQTRKMKGLRKTMAERKTERKRKAGVAADAAAASSAGEASEGEQGEAASKKSKPEQ